MVNRQKDRPIRIWEFENAPEKYKKLCDPDDIDWLAFIPKEVYENNYYFPFFSGYEWGEKDNGEWVFVGDGYILVYKHA